MDFGIRYCNTGPYVDPERAVELVQAAEDAGFESAWTVEHTVIPLGYESHYEYAEGGRIPGADEDVNFPDPLIWMAYVAAATSRIRLATGILILPLHNPVHVAKQVSTLDHMSGGRVMLGIGVGWLEEEFDVLGASFHDRGRRTDDYIEAMRELWRSDRPTHDGPHVSFTNALMRPKPVNGTVPIIIGGQSPAAARRAGRLGDGFFPARDFPPELIAEFRRAAEEAGRDPDSIEITASLPDDESRLPELAAAGVTRILVPVTDRAGIDARVGGPDQVLAWRDRIEQLAGL